MRRFPAHPRLLALAATALLAPAPAALQVGLCASGGDVGGTITYTVTGPVGKAYVLVPSFNDGPTPIAIFDPADPRSLDVGLDLFSFASSGFLVTGTDQVVYPIPNSPVLVGFGLRAQVATLFGVATLLDELSNTTRTSLGTAQGSHNPLDTMGLSRQGHTLTKLLDGRILIAGGAEVAGDGTLMPGDGSWEIYDPKTETFTTSPNSMTLARGNHTATLLDDGRVLFLGGYVDPVTTIAVATAEIYDPATDSTTAVASMSEPRTQHTATKMQDGRVLVAGGAAKFELNQVLSTLASTLDDTEIYDPTTDTWSAGPNLDGGLVGHQATLLQNGRVLICGGVQVDTLFGLPVPGFSDTCYRYNPNTGNLQGTASMPAPFAYHAQLTLSDGRTIVAGGSDGDLILLNFTPRSKVYQYNLTSNSWTTLGDLNVARPYGELFEFGNQILLFGGLNTVDLVSTFGTPETSIEVSDLSAISWDNTPQMLLPREVSRSIIVGDRILTIGSGDDGQPTNQDLTAEYYTP